VTFVLALVLALVLVMLLLVLVLRRGAQVGQLASRRHHLPALSHPK
jgi:hypothetical protein